MGGFRSTAILSVVVFLSGCGGNPGSIELATYRRLHPVLEAPAALSNAVAATVRVTGQTTGTGFFVDPNGLLVTNNHVLGSQNAERSRCAAEGCWITITFAHQQGGDSTREEIFATPVRASQSLDVAVYQLWEDAKATKRYSTPSFLAAGALVEPEEGMGVNVIGHPNSALKHWSAGRVYEVGAPFFKSTNFSIGGNSGSPMVDDDGRLVGILHHVAFGHTHVAADDIRVFSEATTASAVKAMVLGRAGLRTTAFPSLRKARSVEEAAYYSDIYLLAHDKNVSLASGKVVPMLEVLAEQCDVQLKRDLPVSDDFRKEHAACYDALDWINCRVPDEGKDFKSCPVGADKTDWQKRFDALGERAWEAHLPNPYQTVISPLFFEKDDRQKESVHRERLDAFVNRHRPSLRPLLAYYLLDAAPDESKATYAGVPLVRYVLDFKKIRAYAQDYEHLISAALYLYRGKVIDDAQFRALTGAMLADKALPLGDRLNLEEELYLEAQRLKSSSR